jgi:molybdate transport system substrate-binding protein
LCAYAGGDVARSFFRQSFIATLDRGRKFATLIAAMLPMVGGSPAAGGDDITVFAAASLTNAAQEIGAAYEAQGKGRVVFSFASTAELAKQIENGAPAAVFIAADALWMDYLRQLNLIAADSRRNLLGNRLVLIAPADSALAHDLVPGADLAAALGDGKTAIADPDSVPAGRYGEAALEALRSWAALQSNIVRTKDVRAALALVERGEAVAGIVYRTDALASDRVRIVAEFPPDSHPPIVYPIAIVAEHDGAAARSFHRFMTGAEVRAVFERHGFTVLGPGAAAY